MDMTVFEIFEQEAIVKNFLNTFILLICVIVIRMIGNRSIEKLKTEKESKLEWKTHFRSACHLLFVIGIFIVWGSELRTLALSLVAIAAAIAIGMKEFILCLMGGLLKSISRPFKMGDRIEIHHFRGDVISHDFLTTTIFEIGPNRLSHYYTGRRIAIPNSLLLSYGVVNETKKFKYGLHAFTVSLPSDTDILHHRKVLLEAAQTVCEEYKEQAQKYIYLIGEKNGLEIPNAEPKVSVSFSSGDAIDLVVRVPIPALKSGKIEQSIIQHYIEKRQ